MAKQKSAQAWIEEIDDALAYREHFAREASWNKLELDYLNDASGDAAIGPNLIHSMGDSLMSSLQVPMPEFVVTPERQVGLAKAPIVESLDNYLLRKLRLQRYINAALLNGFLYSTVILKVGYDSEFSWSPYYDIGQGNNLLGLSFTQFNKTGHRIESPDTQPGWPWVRPVLPHDLVVPWGTIFLEDCPWVAHRVIRHIDHVKADPKYKHTDRLEGAISMEDFMKSYASVGARKHRSPSMSKGFAREARKPEFIELWEIRDRMTGKILVVNRDTDEFLRNENDAIQLACGLPFVACSLVQSPRSFWSTPPAYYLGQIQKTEFDISLQAEKQRRLSVLKFLYRQNCISAAELTKALSGDVGAAAGVSATYPLSEIIAPLNTGTTFDYIAHSEANRSNAREAVGFSLNQLGEYDASSRRTAREATFVASGSQRRMDRQTGLVVGLYEEVINKVNSLVFEFWRVPREILTEQGWQYTTGPDLKGDYQYEVNLSFKRQISRAERKMESLMLFSQLAAIPGIDTQALFQMLASASGDVAFEKILAPAAGGGGGGAKPAATGALPTIPATQTGAA